MPTGHLVQPVVTVGACGHREPEPVLRNLVGVDGRLGREHIVEGGQAVASAGLQEDTEILGVPVRCTNEPEEDLALEKGGCVGLRIVSTAKISFMFGPPSL